MRLKEIEKEAKREEILNAARKLFSEKGFDHTSMEEVAKAAKIAKGTVYLYFESKVVLFFEVIRFAKNRMMEQVKRIYESVLPPLEKIKQMMMIQLDFMEGYPEYVKIFLMIHHSASDHLKESLIRFFNEDTKEQDALQAAMKLIEEGIERGELKENLNPKEEVYRLWFLVHGLSIARNITCSDVFKKNWRWAIQKSERLMIEETLNLILNSYKKQPQGEAYGI